ncbi:signal transduction histidine-protein kinase/phosphatase DegS [mine drainage metagenome]|uniref:Signal transduction histidine-protein kinase/phosphatase DegS n=1 Tax=mine drainage metagenome TaxID=410659 RepID=A0A1J5Q2X2_9ZZZZ
MPGLVFRLCQRENRLRFTFASEAAVPVCGLPAADLLKSTESFVNRLQAQDRADFKASLQASALHGQAWNWEGRILIDDAPKWINIRATVVRPDPVTVQWDGIMLNISHGRRREASLRDMAAHMELAREQERARLARDIHDELGQLLTALKMDISLLRRRLGPDDAQLQSMAGLVDAATAAGRRVAAQLRPAVLDLGLSDGLTWLAEQFTQRYRLQVERDLDSAGELDDMTAIQIFRIAQEAFTNIARHAQARAVRLRLQRTPGLIALDIADDGIGLSAQTNRAQRSFGLRGMRERAHLLHGTLDCISAPGQGTTIRVRIPCCDAPLPADHV